MQHRKRLFRLWILLALILIVVLPIYQWRQDYNSIGEKKVCFDVVDVTTKAHKIVKPEGLKDCGEDLAKTAPELVKAAGNDIHDVVKARISVFHKVKEISELPLETDASYLLARMREAALSINLENARAFANSGVGRSVMGSVILSLAILLIGYVIMRICEIAIKTVRRKPSR